MRRLRLLDRLTNSGIAARAGTGICLLVLLLCLPGASVSAADTRAYGQGGYSECASGGVACPQPTVVTTPQGPDFAVNLEDGQIIPESGYTIRVTTLHAQTGEAFDKVEFYIGGELAQTVQNDGSGTFSWQWVPLGLPGDTVKVQVYNSDGTFIEKTFKVNVEAVSSDGNGVVTPAPGAPPEDEAGQSGGIAEFFSANGPVGQLAKQVSRALKAIPDPVARAFPYLLFVLLGIGMLLAMLQARREAADIDQLARTLRLDQELAAAKDGFIQLASHYLRTPLTIMQGAIEIGRMNGGAAAAAWEKIAPQVEGLHLKVEELLGGLSAAAEASGGQKAPAPSARIWLRPGFVIPLAVVGLLTVGFSGLVKLAGSLDVSIITLMTQVLILCLLGWGLYVLERGRTLRNAERKRAEAERRKQIELDSLRNQLIHDSVQSLVLYVNGIRNQAAALAPDNSVQLLNEGNDRVQKVLDRFALAERLEVGRVERTITDSSLRELIDLALAPSSDSIASKQLTILYPDDCTILCQSREFFVFVLESVLSNAVGYSPQAGTITIEAFDEGPQTVVRVADEGPGIPKDKLALLFQPFARAEGAISFDHEGMGFSLYLDKMIMSYLQGDISVESAKGRGTKVSISLQQIQ